MDLINDLEPIQEIEELEEINFLIQDHQHPYKTKNRLRSYDLFNKLSDDEFIARFRLTKDTVVYILELIEDELRPPSNRNNAIKPLLQLLITLRFYASGSFYITVADFGKMHKSTAARIINRVTTALSRLRNRFIYLPETADERAKIMRDFYSIARFPRVLGAVDGTHIRIHQSPGGPLAENFRNRKGYFSINVQVVADSQNYIRDIVSRWPGASHDSNIFDNSRVRMRFENNYMGNGLLLGDSGYALRSYMITPLANPITEGENLFNESQIRTRNVVERSFGIWKRFPILSNGMRCNLRLIQKIIIAVAILHNIALNRNEPLPHEDEDYDFGEINHNNGHDNQNEVVRQTLIHYFSNL